MEAHIIAAKVTTKSANGKEKPKKPYPDFPLFPHATRRWAKKIRGKLHYFGPWDDPQAALKKYQEQRDDLHAGRTPRSNGDGLELRHLLNHFLSAKERKMHAGEMQAKTFGDYRTCCERLADAFGRRRLVDDLCSEDFGLLRAQLAKVRGPVALTNEIHRVRSVFKYGYEAGLLDRPTRFGPEFKKPERGVIRKAREARPARLFSAKQIIKLYDEASIEMQAIILLGINCGWGNHDIATLRIDAVDLDNAVATHPRPKTGIKRRATLWPQTVAAVRKALAMRSKTTDADAVELLFITKFGKAWVQGKTDSVGLEFGKLLRRLKIKQDGVNFYALRHTFRTIADEIGDRPAIDRIMGHENGDDIATHYREGIEDGRLRNVTDHVCAWLFGKSNQRG